MNNYIVVKKLFITIVCVSIILPGVSAATEQSYLYDEITGDKRNDFKWTLETQDNLKVITASNERESFTNICTPDGKTIKWHARIGSDTDIAGVRVADKVKLKGIFKGNKVNKSVDIDESPWFQPLSFSLRSLPDSGVNIISFWTIRIDTLELVNMQAENLGIDTIEIAGEEVQAHNVEIRKKGLLSSLWNANYWFRAEDNIFVQYLGTHGLPGVTSETRITLDKRSLRN